MFFAASLGLLCAYGIGVVFAFQVEEFVYHLRRENPCAFTSFQDRLGGDGLRGMLLRSFFSWYLIYTVFRTLTVHPDFARKD